MPRRFSKLLFLLAAVIISSMLTAINPQQTHAQAGDWFATALPNFEDSNVFASPNGGVVQVGCRGHYTTGTETSGPFIYEYDATNGIATSNVSGVFKENVIDCDQGSLTESGSAIGADGTYYTVLHDYNNGYTNSMQAYRNGAAQWPAALQISPLAGCSGTVHMGKLHVGADQDLYFIGTLSSYSCQHNAYLFGVDATTGAVKFQKPLTKYGTYRIGIHQNGLVVWWANNYDEFYYFSYSGAEDVQRRFEKDLEAGRHLTYWMIHPSGTMYMVLERNDNETCASGSQIAYAVVRRDLQGIEYIYDIYDHCKRTSQIALTPNGGAVLLSADPGFYSNGDVLIHLHPNGTSSITDIHRAGASLSSDRYRGFHVDMRGNIMTVQEVGKDVYFTLFSSAGTKLAEYNTNTLRASEDDEFDLRYQSTAIANGAIYAPVCFRDRNGSCGYMPSYHKLLKASFAELDYAYPDAAILGYQSQQVETLEYVALGDSFSSGEGVPDFMPPSDTNGCHRSYDAYARLLDADSAVPLQLDNFVACSGATTNAVQVGMNTESGQLDALSASTDVVTISAGGNDVEFKAFAEECFYGTCDENSAQYQQSMALLQLELPSDLAALLGNINNTAENAQVYVVGYPYMIPKPEDVYVDPYWGVEGCVQHSTLVTLELTFPEVLAIRDLTDALNDVIQTRVEALNQVLDSPRFTFVDPTQEGSPFLGHEFCLGEVEPYFNSIVEYANPHSLHPNQAGQRAYYALIRKEMLLTN